jgi:hypothetical protein
VPNTTASGQGTPYLKGEEALVRVGQEDGAHHKGKGAVHTACKGRLVDLTHSSGAEVAASVHQPAGLCRLSSTCTLTVHTNLLLPPAAAVSLLPPAGGYGWYTYTCGGASLPLVAASAASACWWMGPAVPAAVNVDASEFRSKGSRNARPTWLPGRVTCGRRSQVRPQEGRGT